MNNHSNNLQNSKAQCCVDYCQTTLMASAGEVVNRYKCDQRVFATANMWAIQKQRKSFTLQSRILVRTF